MKTYIVNKYVIDLCDSFLQKGVSEEDFERIKLNLSPKAQKFIEEQTFVRNGLRYLRNKTIQEYLNIKYAFEGFIGVVYE